MRFKDRKHQQQVQASERNDPQAQALIKEFCELINFPYQQQQGYFAVGFYTSVLPVAALRVSTEEAPKALPGMGEAPEPLADPAQPPPTEPAEPLIEDVEVATAEFGDVLDLDKELDLTPDSEDPQPDPEPQSTSEDASRQ
jgi:hypothetical protein